MQALAPKETDAATRRYRIAAIDRAMRVIDALAENPEQGVSELARRLGMTKSLIFRILHTLEERGYVARHPDRAVFSLGYRMGALGERATAQKGLMLAALSVMDQLRDETSENINLIVRDGETALVVATREGLHSMRLFAEPWRHGPLHAGGGSLLLLAHAPQAVQDSILTGELETFTARTISDPAALRRRLTRIRDQGWNIAQDDLDEGAFSVAAPIRDAGGRVVAAISVAGALARFDENRRELYLAAVRSAAVRISARLGGEPAADKLAKTA